MSLCPLLGLDLLLVLKPRQAWGRNPRVWLPVCNMGVLTMPGHLPVFSGSGEQPVGLGFLLQLEGRALLGECCPHHMVPWDFHYTINKPTPGLHP